MVKIYIVSHILCLDTIHLLLKAAYTENYNAVVHIKSWRIFITTKVYFIFHCLPYSKVLVNVGNIILSEL